MSRDKSGGSSSTEKDGEWEYYDASTSLSSFWGNLVDCPTPHDKSEKLLSLWMKEYDAPRDDLQELNPITDYWRITVPRLLSQTYGHTSINQKWKESDIKSQLLDPLEAFIAGTTDVESAFSALAGGDNQSTVCGHVFLTGETCYSCRECALDNTCVMCSTCFQNSEHKNHPYRMYTGQGGGLCDCGDPEAFVKHHTCSLHQSAGGEGTSKTSTKEALDKVPADMRKRTEFLFKKIVKYVFDVTASKSKVDYLYICEVDKETFPELKHATEFSNHCLTLLNDNHHTFDMVQGHPERANFADAVMLNDTVCWKEVRKAWYNVLIEGIMKDYEAKKKLAKSFIFHYPALMDDFCNDDQEDDYTITNMSLQFFTVPTIAHDLLRHDNALNVLAEYFIKHFEEQYDGEELVLEHWMEGQNSEFYRAKSAIDDMRYLLSKAPDPEEWDSAMRRNFSQGCESIVSVLAAVQGLDQHRRETGGHVEYESQDWDNVLKLLHPVRELVNNVVAWCKTDKTVCISVLNMVVDAIKKDHNKRFASGSSPDVGNKVITYSNSGGEERFFNVNTYDVLSSPVSINTPLQRLMASLITLFDGHGSIMQRHAADRVTQKNSLDEIVDPVMSTLTMLQQHDVGLWARNGGVMHGLSAVYNYLLPEQKNLDLVMMQAAMALHDDPGQLLASLVERFGVTEWFKNGCPRPYAEKEVAVQMANSLLLLVVAILSERYHYGVSLVSEKDKLRHEVIQHLSTGPMAFSQIQRLVEDSDADTMLQEPLKEVGNLTQSKKDPSKKVFELKPEYKKYHNLFYYFYRKDQRSHAVIHQKELSKKDEVEWCSRPGVTPDLTETFKGITNLSSCVPMTAIIESLFNKVKKAKNEDEVEALTEHLQKVLFIIIIGCEDDKKAGKAKFVSVAHQCNFYGQLKEMTPPSELKPLVRLTMEILESTTSSLLNVSTENSSAVQPSTSGAEGKQVGSSSGSSDDDVIARKRRAEAAAERRAKIMAQMNKAQQKFATKNAIDLSKLPEDGASTGKGGNSAQPNSPGGRQIVALGKGRNPNAGNKETHVCVLCQEEQVTSPTAASDPTADIMVVACFVCKTTVLSQGGLAGSVCNQVYPEASMRCVPTATTCGHAMHSKCFQKFYDSLLESERNNLFRSVNVNVNWQEFICPACQRLCNSVAPLMPAVTSITPFVSSDQNDFKTWSTKFLRLVSESAYIEDGSKKMHLGKSDDWFTITDACKLATSIQLDQQSGHESDEISAPVIPANTQNMMATFSLNVMKKTLPYNVIPFEDDGRMLNMSNQTLITSIQLSQSKEDGNYSDPVLEMTQREHDTLRSLTISNVCLPFTGRKQLSGTKRKAIWEDRPIFKTLRGNGLLLTSILTSERIRTALKLPSPDLFGSLVILLQSVPSIFFSFEDSKLPVGKHDHHVVRLVFIANLVKVVMGLRPDQSLRQSEVETDEDKAARRLVKTISQVSGASDPSYSMGGTGLTLAQTIKSELLRFLRCASLYVHFYTDVPLPQRLPTDQADKPSTPDTVYETLCTYLALPTKLTDLVASEGFSETADMFSGVDHTQGCVQPLKRRKLIPLKADYLDVLAIGDQYKVCPKTGDPASDPAMCLICGALLCQGTTCCSQAIETADGKKTCGGCTVHAQTCSGGIGIFLDIKKCRVILSSDAIRGTFVAAPYVDEFGETDFGLQRGNPLKLDQALYKELNFLWQNNNIPDKIARLQNQSRNFVPRWHAL